MGGEEGDMFRYFKTLMINGLYTLRKHAEYLITMIEIMSDGAGFSCFRRKEVIEELKERFKCCYSEDQCIEKVGSMVEYSMGNWKIGRAHV